MDICKIPFLESTGGRDWMEGMLLAAFISTLGGGCGEAVPCEPMVELAGSSFIVALTDGSEGIPPTWSKGSVFCEEASMDP